MLSKESLVYNLCSSSGELGWKSLGSLVCTKEGDDEGGCCRKIFKFENETNKEREMAFDILELDERTAGYGHQVWRAAAALCIWILKFVPNDKSSLFGHAKVLELGSGIGLPSLVLSSIENHPFSVTATDLSSLLLDNFLENLSRNKSLLKLPIKRTSPVASSGVSGFVLNWDDSLGWDEDSHSDSEWGCFDVIFGADLVYNPAHAKTLVAAVCRFLSFGGKFVLMNPPKAKRRGMGSFVEELKKRGNVRIIHYKLLESEYTTQRKLKKEESEFDMDLLIFEKNLRCITTS